MADNQMVKIDFQFDLGNVPASSKAFANYLKGIGVDLKFTKASTDALAASVEHLATAQTKAASAGAAAGNSIKKSNMQWTNLALVIQDLPYGFRGIQNNLPALMGGIAGMAGPLYLVGSAIIALFTAWDAGLFKTKDATDALKKSQEEYNKSLKSSLSTAYTEISSIKALISVAQNHKTSMDNRLLAVKKLQDEYPAYFSNLSQEKILNGELSTAINSVSGALLARAEATALEGKMGVLATEKLANEEKLLQYAIEKTKRLKSHKEYLKSPLVSKEQKAADAKKDMVGIMLLDIRTKENELIKRNLDIQKEGLVVQEKINKLTTVALPLETNKPKDVKDKKQKVDEFNILDATKKFYDAKLNFAEGDEVAQRDILLREKETFDQLINGNQISYQDYYTNVSEIYKKLIDFQIKEDKRLYDSQIKFAGARVDQIKSTLGVEMKLNKNNVAAQKEAIKKAMAVNAVLAMSSSNPEAILKYQEAFSSLGDQLNSFKDIAQQTGEILHNSLVSGVETLGESIGKSLATGKFDFTGLGTVLADALTSIGKALIAYALTSEAAIEALKNPLAWPIALGAGLLAVAAGAFLKSKLTEQKSTAFANGGIVSGPTMGLVGEYPGAKSNPEVVAPLDKLKEMIGGGAGQFVLRGQDLLLSVNRAQKASNLKGQSISLA